MDTSLAAKTLRPQLPDSFILMIGATATIVAVAFLPIPIGMKEIGNKAAARDEREDRGLVRKDDFPLQ